MVLLPAVMVSPFTPAPAPVPLSTTTGLAPVTKSGSLVPSMTTALLIVGNAAATLIVCAAPTRAPGMSNTILSGAAPLAVLLAAKMASRRLMRPSAPRALPGLAIDVVVPSATSLTVSTTTMPVEVAVTLAANSDVLP